MAEGKFIAYYRVSTKKQGLGLAAQKQAVANFLNGGKWALLGEYEEVESGKKDDRPELLKAIRDCELKNAKLVVAKLDRLSRDVHFITSLQKTDIKFVVAECPEMTELTVHIYASMAQHERKMISERTKAGLAQVKKKGTKLGNPVLLNGGRIEGSGDTTKARTVKNAKAQSWRKKMENIIADITTENSLSLRQIALELNTRGFVTPRGKNFEAMSVKLILDNSKIPTTNNGNVKIGT